MHSLVQAKLFHVLASKSPKVRDPIFRALGADGEQVLEWEGFSKEHELRLLGEKDKDGRIKWGNDKYTINVIPITSKKERIGSLPQYEYEFQGVVHRDLPSLHKALQTDTQD